MTEKVFQELIRKKVRRPSDWRFDYSGSVEFRWWDSPTDHFGGSINDVTLYIGTDSFKVNSTREAGDKRSFDDKGRSCLQNLPLDDSITILEILVRLMDKDAKAREKKKAVKP